MNIIVFLALRVITPLSSPFSVLRCIVCGLGQRVVKNLVEAGTHKLFADKVGQLVLLVLLALDDQR
jgi:hypothetical protein